MVYSADRSTQKDTSSSAVTSSLSDLIARLEKATGPDRELDEQIQAAISGATLEKQADGRNAYHRDGFWVSIGKVLPYTSSIDAAITLVPEGWTRAVDATSPKAGIDVDLYPPDNNDPRRARGTHGREPVATCIAALRARSLPAI